MSKLVIAKFGEEIIHVSQYQKILHWEKIYCPFCNPPLLLEYNVLGHFKAWRNKGGHNCGKINVSYFDADWEGKQYVEIVGNNDGTMNITIDINTITKPMPYDGYSTDSQTSGAAADELRFPKYEHKEKIFREVITSVYQMKKLIEKNEFNSLKKLNYFFKIDENEPLNFNEVVYKCNEIDNAPHNKRRFCIFDVEKVNTDQKGNIYLNSYIRDSYQITGVLRGVRGLKEKLPNLRKKFQGQFVIAFGRIGKPQREKNKVYLEVSNDFCIVKLNDEVKRWFKDSEKQSFVYSPKKKVEDSHKEQYATICTNNTESLKIMNDLKLKETMKSTEMLQVSKEISASTKKAYTDIASTTEPKGSFNKTIAIENASFINKVKCFIKTIFNW